MIDNENEEVNQNSNMQYIHKNDSEKSLIENSVQYAVAFGKLFFMWEHAGVILFEYYLHKQTKMFELSSLQGCHAETFSDGFREFHFVLH